MIRASIRRPVMITMIYLVLTALGVAAWYKVPIEHLPDATFPRLTVTASWAGSSAEAVEAFVTSPLEGEIQLVKGVEKVTSSSREGQASITVEFARETDMDFARLELVERLRSIYRNRLRPLGVQSPPSVSPYIPEEIANQRSPFLLYRVSGPYVLEALRDHVDREIVPALLEVDGVATVQVSGGSRREIVIVMNEAKLNALGINQRQVMQTIADLEFVADVGEAKDEGVVRTVTVRQTADSLVDIRRLVLPSTSGRIVRVSDVAEIYDTFADPAAYQRINGFPMLAFTVVKEPRTNVVSVAERVKNRMAELAPEHPPGVQIKLLNDESELIKVQLNDIRNRTLLSAAIIFAVLLLFLQSFRSAFIVFSTIVFAILITLNLMYAAGYTMNVLSLMALAMGFGLVVDVAIVVLENVYRRWKLGEAPEIAAEEGSREVVLAVLAGTLTTIVVFIPFVYLQGELRLYYFPIAIIVGFGQIASIFVAFTFIPALAARLLTGRARKDDPVVGPLSAPAGEVSRVPSYAGRPFYVRMYAGLLGVTLRFPWISLTLAAVMLYGSYSLFDKYVSRGYRWSYGASNRSTVSVRIGMPYGEQLDRTDELARYFDYRLRRMDGIEEFRTNVTSRNASILVYFPDSLEYTAVPEIVYDQIASYGLGFAGPSFNVSGSGKSFYTPGGMSTAGSQSITVYGYNFEKVREIAEDVGSRLEKISRVHDVDVSSTGRFAGERALELWVVVDRERLAVRDITMQEVVDKVRAAVMGNAGSATVRIGGLDIPIEGKIEGYRERDVLELQQLLLRARTGEEVMLSDVARIEERRAPSEITRENQRYQRIVRYEFRGPAKLAERERKRIVDETIIPQGYSVIGASEYRVSTDEQKQIWGVLILSVILIFMVTASLFESIRHPIVVLFTIPMALIGVFLVFFYINATFTREAYIGVIMMGGIVVNNSILLVDRVNQLRRRDGWALEPALIQGTLDRVRPILMTTTVTIAGLLPLVLFSESPDANIWNALGYALIGGLTSSTLLVLSLTPALYLIFERRAERKRVQRLLAATP
jgi:HAE1 family hydrophobic/amphiphilic exporter-1